MVASDTPLHLYAAISCGISAVCILIIIVTYFSFERLRRHPYNLVIYRVICDLIFVGLLVAIMWVPTDECDECLPWSLLVQFFGLAGQAWYFSAIMDIYFSATNPFFDNNNYIWLHHVFSWGLASLSAAVMYFAKIYGISAFGMCWVKQSHGKYNLWTWLLFFGPSLVLFFASVVVWIFVRKQIKRSLTEMYSSATRNRTLEFSRSYIAWFAVYWACVAIIYFMSFLQEFESNVLNGLVIVGLGARGVVDLITWSYSFESIGGYRAIFKSHRKESQMLKQIQEDKRDDDLQKVLRMDILHATGQGIFLSAHYAHKAIKPTPSSPQEQQRHIKSNHVNANRDDGEEIQRSFCFARDYVEKVRHERRWCEGNGTQQSANLSYVFFDYAPKVFDAIRCRFGLSREKYLNSFGSFTGPRWRAHPMHERSSDGRSGAFFYVSQDNSFVIKTTTRQESKMLRALLPKYHAHINENPDTFICHFYGCHALRIHSRTIYFVVMNNVFPSLDIHMKFDLKGSWVNRSSFPKSSSEAQRTSTPTNTTPNSTPTTSQRKGSVCSSTGSNIKESSRRALRRGTLKDGDFVSSQARLNLPPAMKEKMFWQLCADCKFLEQCGVMDFSLLLGIHQDEQIHASSSAIGPTISVENTNFNNPLSLTSSGTPQSQNQSSSVNTTDIAEPVGPLPTNLNRNSRTNANSEPTNLLYASGGVDSQIAPSRKSFSGYYSKQWRLRDQQKPKERTGSLLAPLLAKQSNNSVRTEPPHLRNWGQADELMHLSASCPTTLPSQSGIAYVETPPPVTEIFHRPYLGGVPSLDWGNQGGCVYFVGIIDVLQGWDFGKRRERWFKTFVLRQDPYGVSAVPPHQYHERFLERMKFVFGTQPQPKK